MSSIQNPTATETETQKQEEVPVTSNAMEVDSKVSLINELGLHQSVWLIKPIRLALVLYTAGRPD